MRVFENPWFHRWMKKASIDAPTLCRAAQEIVEGKVEADLGGGLFKKRVTRPGSGKSGGYRVVTGYRAPNSERIVFVYAFAKNQRTNISSKEKEALTLVAKAFFEASDAQVSQLLKLGRLIEVDCNERTA